MNRLAREGNGIGREVDLRCGKVVEDVAGSGGDRGQCVSGQNHLVSVIETDASVNR